MIVFQITFHIPPHFAAAFAKATLERGRVTRQEPGNLHFELFRDQAEPIRWQLLEAYQDRDAFGAHLRTSHFRNWKTLTEPWQPKRALGTRYHLGGNALTTAPNSHLHFQTVINVEAAQLGTFVAASKVLQADNQAERLLLMQQYDRPNRFVLLESYPDSDAVQAQLQSQSFQNWRATLQTCTTELVSHTYQLQRIGNTADKSPLTDAL
jgi:quinol monooxygenase YgiN